MKIKFIINYHTHWGESLFISGTIPNLGNGDPEKAIEMRLSSPDTWEYELEAETALPDFNYFFIVKAQGEKSRFEWGKPHRYNSGFSHGIIKIFDCWQDCPPDKPYYSSAFTEGMLRRSSNAALPESTSGAMQLKVKAPMVLPNEILAITGEGDWLGNWNPAQARPLSDAGYPDWTIDIPFSELEKPFQYKFLIIDKSDSNKVVWEDCPNRYCGIHADEGVTAIVVDGLRFANPRFNWKGAGTAIPVFSIRTESDFGIGDFEDIKAMVDWCVSTGQKILQVLPVNDTNRTGTWQDSYPYSANSSFALHPMYLRPEAVGLLSDKSRMEHYRKIAVELNKLPEIDYEAVNNAKDAYFREIYVQNGNVDHSTDSFREFFESNKIWLKPYAAWRILCKLHSNADNSTWGKYSVYSESVADAICREYSHEAGYHFFLQYHLDKQLREARDYARAHGVILKGDIPIGVNRHSADAWQNPALFNLDCQAGAPPDDFSVLGQNWGFPTYNWNEMAKDGFSWWKRRFAQMAEYFDAYRVDHILGFFRIWQIPEGAVHGLLGYFNAALPYSPEELKQNFDFTINPETQASPLITDSLVDRVFGEYAREVKDTFLESLDEKRFKLREFVDTQRKVEEHFPHNEGDIKSVLIRNGLMALLDEVLFIEDPYERNHWHPRITANKSEQYKMLSDSEKRCFDRLYENFFYQRNNDFWYEKAMWKLPPLIDSTGMLACGEDLGMIPACVPDVMDKLEILSLEIQRMPKEFGVEFGDTSGYPYLSVCTSSTHDMSGIRSWWTENPQATQRFYNGIIGENGDAPDEADPLICRRIVEMLMHSPSMLCILPLADILSTDGSLRRADPAEERINVPADSSNYWRYRMHLTVEKLLMQGPFNDYVLKTVRDSGR